MADQDNAWVFTCLFLQGNRQGFHDILVNKDKIIELGEIMVHLISHFQKGLTNGSTWSILGHRDVLALTWLICLSIT